jgi:hypothetical protein
LNIGGPPCVPVSVTSRQGAAFAAVANPASTNAMLASAILRFETVMVSLISFKMTVLWYLCIA